MLKVAFVCLGNICRSPMAEAIFRQMTVERGISDSVEVDSFGTSDEEEGNAIYPLALKTLESHGITAKHTAKKITAKDVARFDYIVVMERRHLGQVLMLTSGKYSEKVMTLRQTDVVDPWYTRNFEKAYADIYDGCAELIEKISDKIATE